MLIAYYSMTGNVRRFVSKLSDFECVDITKNPLIEEDFILITSTYGFGKVPNKVVKFLECNKERLSAVASSGNKNWGEQQFARSGDLIAESFKVPLLLKFENSGFPQDVELFKERVLELYGKMD